MCVSVIVLHLDSTDVMPEGLQGAECVKEEGVSSPLPINSHSTKARGVPLQTNSPEEKGMEKQLH